MVKAERNGTRPTLVVEALLSTVWFPCFCCAFLVMAVKPLFFYPKRVNVLGQRLVSFQIFLVSLWILVFGETASKIPGESGEWCVVPHTPALCTCRGFVPLPPMLPLWCACSLLAVAWLPVRPACTPPLPPSRRVHVDSMCRARMGQLGRA